METVFSRISGHCEYGIMPCVLFNAPSVIQALKDVFRDLFIVCIDNNVVHFSTIKEHIQHVQFIIQRLLDNNLFETAGIFR